MKKMQGWLLAALALTAAHEASSKNTLPLANFVKHPIYSTAKISPDGEYLAITVDRGEQDVLTVLRTSDLSVIKINVLPDRKSVGSFYWTSAQRLLFTASIKQGSFERPRGTGEWFAVNADGSYPRTLIDYSGVRDATQRGKDVGQQMFSLLDTLPNDDSSVMMTARYRRSDTGAGTEVVLMDTLSGRRKSLGRAPADNCSIVLTADKQPGWAVCSNTDDDAVGYDPHTDVYQRGSSGQWTRINSSKDNGKRLRVLGSSAKGEIYAFQDNGKAPPAFGVLDPENGDFTELFHDGVAEVSSFVQSIDGSEQILAAVTEAGAPQVSLIDENHPDTSLYMALSSSFPGQFVNFSSATADGRKVVVSVYSDRNPGELYLFDRDTGKANFLLKSRPWIDPEQMGTTRSISFTAPDGRTIYAYLTVPAGSDGKQLPLILNVHGGPIGPRDNWRYDNESQMFASRGYATLRINYRGSGGFGKEFQDLGYGQWGTGIMDDIIAGVKHAIGNGWVDENRICIYGGSFGGYASLMAPARAPGLFKCAFGYVGMYDAQIQLTRSDTAQSEAGRRYLARAFGSSRAEQDAMSPITHASQLKLPIYLAAGARDARCPPQHTEAMAKALTAAGNKPEGVIIQSGEEHGFYKEENNLNLYTEMLAFFDRHIGPNEATAHAGD